MEYLWNLVKDLSPETVSMIILGLLTLFGLNLKTKAKQLGDLVDELTSSLEDGKLNNDELKRISTKASVLFGRQPK